MKRNKKEKNISLSPLSPDEALKAALLVPFTPPKKSKSKKKKK